jgi:pimeloyl-ACP methyl ester carboxylesterase
MGAIIPASNATTRGRLDMALPLRVAWLAACLTVCVPNLANAISPAEEWQTSGKSFTWQSTLPENQGRPVKVFYVCMGDEAKPAIVMIHGFPTSSFDFRPLITELQKDYRVCTLDFPGYGMSDKPAGNYRYALGEDAKLIWYFVTKVVPLEDFVLFSHDRGDSAALSFLQLYQAAEPAPFRITHQFLTNANMYLPLANLTEFQKAMLNPATSAAVAKSISPERLAVGMGATQYSPPLKPEDPEVRALVYNFAWQDGIQVIPDTIQYLNERRQLEVAFLEALAKSNVPVTLMWGMHDMVSPVRVGNYVWSTALKLRGATASFWLIPCANHYLVHDQADNIAAVMRGELGPTPTPAPLNLTSEACSPVLVDRK